LDQPALRALFDSLAHLRRAAGDFD
jgi:hypothetical protein